MGRLGEANLASFVERSVDRFVKSVRDRYQQPQSDVPHARRSLSPSVGQTGAESIGVAGHGVHVADAASGAEAEEVGRRRWRSHVRIRGTPSTGEVRCQCDLGVNPGRVASELLARDCGKSAGGRAVCDKASAARKSAVWVRVADDPVAAARGACLGVYLRDVALNPWGVGRLLWSTSETWASTSSSGPAAKASWRRPVSRAPPSACGGEGCSLRASPSACACSRRPVCPHVWRGPERVAAAIGCACAPRGAQCGHALHLSGGTGSVRRASCPHVA